MSTKAELLRGAALAALVELVALGAGCGAPEEVHGRAAALWATEEGLSGEDAIDLSRLPIRALVPTAEGYQVLPGRGERDGSFQIPGVPEGPFWLRFPDELGAAPEDRAGLFVWTAARELDLGYRSSGQAVPIEGARLQLRISGLLPTERDDVLTFSTASGRWSGRADQLPAGETALDWPHPLPGALPGERVSARQWRAVPRDGKGRQGRVIVRGGAAVVPDGSAALDVPLVAAPPRGLRAVLDPLLPEPPEGHDALRASLRLLADPDPLGLTPGSGERLVELDATTAVPLGATELPYGDPAPGAWARRYWAKSRAGRRYHLPGTARAEVYCEGGAERSGPLDELAAGPIGPRLWPPRALQVDGQGALGAALTAGAAPTVRWRPPALGDVSFYRLELRRLVQTPEGYGEARLAATFLTTETEVRVPPGELRPGEIYLLALTAYGGVLEDVTRAPRLAALATPPAAAQLCSALVRIAD